MSPQRGMWRNCVKKGFPSKWDLAACRPRSVLIGLMVTVRLLAFMPNMMAFLEIVRQRIQKNGHETGLATLQGVIPIPILD